MKKKYYFSFLIAILCLTAVSLFSLGWGTYQLELGDIMKTLFGGGSKLQNTVIFSIRLPRICLAIVVGMALSTAGCILQGITKNDLAEPGIIGINAGAALAVVLVIFSGMSYYSNLSAVRFFMMPVAALIGAFVSGAFVYGLSLKKGKIAPGRLILVGIGVNAGINAFITLYQLNMSGGDYNRALTWISGSLWGSSWKYFWLVTPLILLVMFLALYKSKTLDVMELGDELSIGLGIAVEKNRRILLFYAVALSALATAVAGNIAFLGMLGSHIAKRLVGPVHRRKIPMAGLISATLLVFADALSRNLFSPVEIPAGITVSIVGVPYFIYLMGRKE